MPDGEGGGLPSWLRPLARALGEDPDRGRPAPAGRAAAVLLLFGDGPDLLLIERAGTLRTHAGQPALPGGAVDPDDSGPVGAALREAGEEVGVEAGRVHILGTLAPRRIRVSGFAVTPVLGYCPDPNPVRVVDPAEVAAVVRAPLTHFTAPERRFLVRHSSGSTGPGFRLDGMLVWGFTAWVIDRVLTLAGWAEPLTAETSSGILSSPT